MQFEKVNILAVVIVIGLGITAVTAIVKDQLIIASFIAGGLVMYLGVNKGKSM